MFALTHSNTQEDERIGLAEFYCVFGLHNCLKFSQPPSCLDEAM